MSAFAANDRSLDRYVSDISAYPLLSREQEAQLAAEYRATASEAAAQRLVVCNLRFVVKTAHAYRGYGLRLLDLIQEGNMGLMVAVRKFDPGRGYRLVSYAVWWIRAYIQSFIIRAWSLVKVGTTQAQRKLFFRLRSERERAHGAGTAVTAEALAARLGVLPADVRDMDVRLGERDFSLDAQVVEGGRSAHVDLLLSDAPGPQQRAEARQLRRRLRATLAAVMPQLNAKERYIVSHRMLRDAPPTLGEIGRELDISRERVRQIEGAIVQKLRVAMAAPARAAAAA